MARKIYIYCVISLIPFIIVYVRRCSSGKRECPFGGGGLHKESEGKRIGVWDLDSGNASAT